MHRPGDGYTITSPVPRIYQGNGTWHLVSGATVTSVAAARTADADSDLFMFCRALAAPDRPQMIGWETINVWEHWRGNGKTLFGGGISPHFMQIELHAGGAEWKQASQRTPLERALLAAGLPPAAAFDVIKRTGSGPPAVYAWGEPS